MRNPFRLSLGGKRQALNLAAELAADLAAAKDRLAFEHARSQMYAAALIHDPLDEPDLSGHVALVVDDARYHLGITLGYGSGELLPHAADVLTYLERLGANIDDHGLAVEVIELFLDGITWDDIDTMLADTREKLDRPVAA